MTTSPGNARHKNLIHGLLALGGAGIAVVIAHLSRTHRIPRADRRPPPGIGAERLLTKSRVTSQS
jgi:hypothetical protein